MNCERLKIIIADPWQYSREQLENFIARDPRFQLQAAATDGCDLLQKMQPQNLPHVLITEIDMPGMGGIDLCRLFDKDYPQINNMVLTHSHDRYAIRQILDTNILGMIPKNTHNADVTRCIEAVGNGHLHICSPYSELKQKLKTEEKPCEYDLQVLQLWYDGYSNEEIARLTHKGKDSVKLAKKRLYKNSKAETGSELTVWALDNGFVTRNKR